MSMRKYYFIAIFFVAGFLVLDYFSNAKMIQLRKPKLTQQTTVVKSLALASQNKMQAKTDSESLLQFKSDFKYEVNQIGQTQAKPEEIENRLQGLARQMEPDHRTYLKNILDDQDINGDDRAMAIELLSRNQTIESADILKNYTTNESGAAGPRSEQEQAFKAQAIEGLAAYQDRTVAISYLSEISKKTNYKFLQDRAQRAQEMLKNEGKSLESQDNEALKQIIR